MNTHERGQLIARLSLAISRGGVMLGQTPDMLCDLIEDKGWQEFETLAGSMQHYGEGADEFVRFITTPPIEGLGTTPERLQQMVEHEIKALNAYQQAINRNGGKPVTRENLPSYKQPDHHSKAGELRRLEKDRPDLHEQVLRNEKSTHAAMIEAGFLPHRVQMPVDDMERLAAALRRNLDAEQLAALTKLLGGF